MLSSLYFFALYNNKKKSKKFFYSNEVFNSAEIQSFLFQGLIHKLKNGFIYSPRKNVVYPLFFSIM